MSGACATLVLHLGKLHTLLENIKIGGKGLPTTNAQAYFVTSLVLKTKKSFATFAPGVNHL
jgi:hypothetical protein